MFTDIAPYNQSHSRNLPVGTTIVMQNFNLGTYHKFGDLQLSCHLFILKYKSKKNEWRSQVATSFENSVEEAIATRSPTEDLRNRAWDNNQQLAEGQAWHFDCSFNLIRNTGFEKTLSPSVCTSEQAQLKCTRRDLKQ